MSEVECLKRVTEYVTECPYCKNRIVIPIYRIKPETMEQLKERTQRHLKMIKGESENG